LFNISRTAPPKLTIKSTRRNNP